MNAAAPKSSSRVIWIIAFCATALVHLASVVLPLPRLVGVGALWLLAPLLAIWVWRSRGPKLLVVALLCCWLGDVLGNPALLGIGPGGLVLGVAAFAGACVVLIVLFVRSGALRPGHDGAVRRRGFAVAPVYLALAAVVLALSWSALAPSLRVVGSVYLLLIVTTATLALVLDIRAGVGAGLLFGSHLLVVLEVGGHSLGSTTVHRLAILALYMAGILLLSIGMVDRAASTRWSDTPRAPRLEA